MKVLFLSTIYPRSYAPTKGIYCLHVCRALAAEHEVRVISPRSWIEVFRHRSAGPAPADVGPTEYPLYLHPPGVLHSRSAGFMWASVRRTVRRVVGEFAPDCVLSYWAHPDGEVAARAARRAGVGFGAGPAAERKLDFRLRRNAVPDRSGRAPGAAWVSL